MNKQNILRIIYFFFLFISLFLLGYWLVGLYSYEKNTDKIASEMFNHVEVTSEFFNKHSSKVDSWIKAKNNEVFNKVGVHELDKSRVSPGYNLVTHNVYKTAYLFDNQGQIVREWSLNKREPGQWYYAKVAKNGDLLAIDDRVGLFRISSENKLVWQVNTRAHHDIYESETGEIFILSEEGSVVKIKGIEVHVTLDFVLKISSDGEILDKYEISKRYFTLDMLPKFKVEELIGADSPYRVYGKNEGKRADVLHTNSLDVLTIDIDGVAKKGDILLSFRDTSEIAIYSPKLDEFVWKTPSQDLGLNMQHNAKFTSEGTIYLFNNRQRSKKSSVLFIDPIKRAVIRSIGIEDGVNFFSGIKGGVQLLNNGNLLIGSSLQGRVIEVAPDMETVWEYYTGTVTVKGEPVFEGKNSSEVSNFWRREFYRVERYEKIENL